MSSSDEARIRLPQQLRLDELLEELQARLDAARVLGFAPSLRMEGLIDTDVSKETADHVIAVLSEALTNMARHARADRAEIALAADGHELVPTVGDNGVGIPPDGRRSGLRNMAERAGQLGGRMEWGCPEGGGTTLVWRVPGTHEQGADASVDPRRIRRAPAHPRGTGGTGHGAGAERGSPPGEETTRPRAKDDRVPDPEGGAARHPSTTEVVIARTPRLVSDVMTHNVLAVRR